jgi:serine/threonine-protein phosphatase 2A regulatory subunit B
MTYHDTIVAAVPRKVYANAHAYHINSISINSDGETYMSADDLRINLWNLNISDQSFSKQLSPLTSLSLSPPLSSEVLPNSVHRKLTACFSLRCRIDILDIKPVNMEELTEVITAAEFHPVSCNLFCYSSSKGTVKLADMREQALCDKHAKREPSLSFSTQRARKLRVGIDKGFSSPRACE